MDIRYLDASSFEAELRAFGGRSDGQYLEMYERWRAWLAGRDTSGIPYKGASFYYYWSQAGREGYAIIFIEFPERSTAYPTLERFLRRAMAKERGAYAQLQQACGLLIRGYASLVARHQLTSFYPLLLIKVEQENYSKPDDDSMQYLGDTITMSPKYVDTMLLFLAGDKQRVQKEQALQMMYKFGIAILHEQAHHQQNATKARWGFSPYLLEGLACFREFILQRHLFNHNAELDVVKRCMERGQFDVLRKEHGKYGLGLYFFCLIFIHRVAGTTWIPEIDRFSEESWNKKFDTLIRLTRLIHSAANRKELVHQAESFVSDLSQASGPRLKALFRESEEKLNMQIRLPPITIG